jgi:hypothetical protein
MKIQRYSETEDATILRMVLGGATSREIGEALKRPLDSVNDRLYKLRVRGLVPWRRDVTGNQTGGVTTVNALDRDTPPAAPCKEELRLRSNMREASTALLRQLITVYGDSKACSNPQAR